MDTQEDRCHKSDRSTFGSWDHIVKDVGWKAMKQAPLPLCTQTILTPQLIGLISQWRRKQNQSINLDLYCILSFNPTNFIKHENYLFYYTFWHGSHPIYSHLEGNPHRTRWITDGFFKELNPSRLPDGLSHRAGSAGRSPDYKNQPKHGSQQHEFTVI